MDKSTAYLSQANTRRSKIVARWQYLLAERLLNEGKEAFVQQCNDFIQNAIQRPDMFGTDIKGNPLAKGVISGLRLIKKDVERKLLIPTLVSSNIKLGRIASFSTLPVITCPDYSSCASECYALRMAYNRPSSWRIFQSWLRNSWLVRHRFDIVEDVVISKMRNARQPFTELRLYVSGDVENQQQADKWSDVCQVVGEMGIRAYGYTKSDVDSPFFLKSVFTLGHDNPADIPLKMISEGYVPAITDTYERSKLIQKQIKGAVICPELAWKKLGRPVKEAPNCEKCGLCSTAVNNRKKGITAILLPLH